MGEDTRRHQNPFKLKNQKGCAAYFYEPTSSLWVSPSELTLGIHDLIQVELLDIPRKIGYFIFIKAGLSNFAG